jgi:penicillin-binding protein 2
MNLHEAFRHSCDVYFYHLGQKLGIERLARYARRFHLGLPTGVDLKGERPGLVPDGAWSQRIRRGPWYPGETISVAIGQGPLQATPLQVAAMMAAVANGGRRVVPHLWPGAVAAPEPLDLDPAALEAVRRGLWAVVNEPGGTGAAARVAGLEVAGKTGTVQVIAQKTWVASEELPAEHRDHAWFASFAPYQDPRLVVVVFSEHGGKGSAEAAPIARALYEQHFQAAPAQLVLVGG